MKKFMCVLIVTMLFCMTACGNDSNEDKTKNTETVTENTEKDEVETSEKKTEEKATEEKTTIDEEASKAAENAELLERMKQIKVSVLAKATMPYEDAMINGWGFYSEDYETATIVTMFVEFPDEEVASAFEGLNLCGDTIKTADGETLPHTYSSTGWMADDGKHALLLMRVAGELDLTTVGVEIGCEIYYDSRVVVELPFENNASEAGFDFAKTCFVNSYCEKYGIDSLVVKLKGRHYFVTKRYEDTYWSSDDISSMSCDMHSFILIPLEGGFTRTLTTADLVVTSNGAVDNTTVSVTINENGVIDKREPKSQTTIDADAKRRISEEEDIQLDSDDKDVEEAAEEKIEQDIEAAFGNTVVGIDDGDGNMIYFKFD